MDTTHGDYCTENGALKEPPPIVPLKGFLVPVATPFGTIAVGCWYDGEGWHFDAADNSLPQGEAERRAAQRIHSIIWSFLPELHWQNSSLTIATARTGLARMGIKTHQGDRSIAVEAMQKLGIEEIVL